jgi:hypothetical protein
VRKRHRSKKVTESLIFAPALRKHQKKHWTIILWSCLNAIRWCFRKTSHGEGDTAMMQTFFWYALVGWVAGWVTGRAMKGSGGWLMRNTYVQTNWGFLLRVIVAATAAVFVTWAVCKVLAVWHNRQHTHHHA